MEQLEHAGRLFAEGLTRQERGELKEAEALYAKALALAPGRPSVMNNLAAVYLGLGRYDEAKALCAQLLELDPRDETALLNLGNALLGMKRWAEALAAYDGALRFLPGHAAAHYNRGNALLKLRRLPEALASYDRSLELEAGHPGALNNRGIVLNQLDRIEEVAATYQRLADAAPDYPYVRGYLLNARLRCCDWTDYAASVARVTGEVKAGRRADTPFNFLVVSGSAGDQLECARILAGDEYPAATPLWRGERYGHRRMRVAYVSADFHEHAVPRLIVGVLEAHDRERFEVTGISIGPDQNDAMRARLKGACDRFIDAREKSDGEIAQLMRDLEIDIAVDLQGYTKGCRTGIFARRPVPVQVNFLGYPGTMGAAYMDYILADEWVVPREDHASYSEKVVYLPDCYQANDARRRIADHVPVREELGLPRAGFVFCCFNNNHKIAPPVFDIWMRLLGKVEGSVLWLLQDNEIVVGNLRREAAARGISPARLVFAPRMKMEEHLSRHRQADLFLDTLPYCAHTTASDALWTGLPVLTQLGGAFAGRVAASLLNAAGMQDLIARTPGEYEARALELAGSPAVLADIKARLARNRATHPLFDTGRFRRHIEAAYVTMRDRVERGTPPQSFAVPVLS